MDRSVAHIFKSLVICIALTACSATVPNGAINDPYEKTNRAIHNTNIQIDKALLKPVSNTYGTVVPDPVRRGLSNVSNTLGLPGVVVNDLLQLQFGDAIHNTARFALNMTVGLGGLLDAASDGAIEPRDTDFGETLHAWGIGEGAYVVLPIYGASTTRDTLGLLVDIVLDPIGSALTPAASTTRTTLKVADVADSRYRYSDLYESIVYDSADGYAQLRLTYLDTRRFELGTQTTQAADTSAAYDIYEDFYE
jgi:phospholipid-binding lipoprotein MlaA